MRRMFIVASLFAGAMLLAGESTLFAQGSTSSTQTTSFFKMFFLPDDVMGLIVTWTLILASAINMALIIKFLMDSREDIINPEGTSLEIETLLSEKRYREAIDFAATDPSYLGKVVNAALSEASNGYSAMERAIEEAADAETTRMLRPCEILNVVGNIAPMLGLFGTVYGMITAFRKLVEAGGKPDPAALAGGISTALVTTLWGLVVAMPALAGYALVRNRIDALTSEGLLRAEELIRPFKPAGKKSSGASATASQTARRPSQSKAAKSAR